MKELQAIKPVQSIGEIVYEQIKTSIMRGGFSDGSRLVEQELAQQLQVSRTPVREALRRLESEGLIESSARQGLVVREYSEAEIREIYMIREALESLAAEFAARNATEEEIQNLDALVLRMKEIDNGMPVDPDEAMTVHRNFSEAYNRASHMPTLVRLIESLKEQVARFRRVSLSGSARRKNAYREHNALLDALKEGDSELASQLTRQHIRNALQAYFESQKKTEVN
ncbi:GntR family transcriptional regulator [Synergistaceae bacterium OttesenSCG-928-D05]|nr:GntR family transcriptional regulator [Synergistaceae bacterium OttesenSCG-928-D05]